MAFDVTAFTDYVDQTSEELLMASITGAESAEMFTLQTGIKSAADLHILDTDVILQTGGDCSRTPSGTTTFTKRELSVASIRYAEDLCPKDLEAKWTQIMLPGGSVYEDINFFAEEYFGRKSQRIASILEKALYQGNTGSGDQDLLHFNGYLKIIDDAGLSQVVTPAAINTTNIRGIMRSVKDAIPDAIRSKDDLIVVCEWATFDTYVNALAIDNLYHKFGDDGVNGEMRIENSNIILKAVDGLVGTNRILAMRKSNFFIGVDLAGEEDQVEAWYSQDDRVVKTNWEFKYGVQIAFLEEVVTFTGS